MMEIGPGATSPDRRLLGDRGGARAMMWVMAIMLFLTVLAGALGLGTRAAAVLLGRQLAGRLTVQIVAPAEDDRTAQARAALAALAASPQVSRAQSVDRAELARLMRPWLGADGDDPDLPIPALIDVDLASASDAAIARVTETVRAVAPSARIDRHESWMSPVTDFMTTLTWLAVGVVLMMASATAAVVILAARSGLERHRDTIQVLHMLGSTDVQVARLFQRRIALDTFLGGALGTALAAMTLVAMGIQLARLESGLLDGFVIGVAGWFALALLPLGFTVLAMLSARVTVLAELRRTL